MNETTTRILVVAPGWLGDVVMAQALCIDLKQHYPGAQLTVLGQPWLADLTAMMPQVDQTQTWTVMHRQLALGTRYQHARGLKGQFDWAIVMPNSFKSALLPWFAGIAKRSGYLGEQRYGLINDRRMLNQAHHPTQIQRYIALGRSDTDRVDWPTCAKPRLVIPRRSYEACAQFSTHTDNAPVIAVCPGAAQSFAKRWPVESYIQCAQFCRQQGWHVWLLGAPSDQIIAQKIAQSVPECQNFVGQTTIEQAIVLLSKADAVVANDSGLLHVAAALDRPLVAIYGPTSPQFTPPATHRAQVIEMTLPCRPCFAKHCPLNHWRCMRSITPAAVNRALEVMVG